MTCSTCPTCPPAEGVPLMPRRYLPPREACRYLTVSIETLRKLRKDGALVPLRVSARRLVYDVGELDRYLAERRRPAS